MQTKVQSGMIKLMILKYCIKFRSFILRKWKKEERDLMKMIKPEDTKVYSKS